MASITPPVQNASGGIGAQPHNAVGQGGDVAPAPVTSIAGALSASSIMGRISVASNKDTKEERASISSTYGVASAPQNVKVVVDPNDLVRCWRSFAESLPDSEMFVKSIMIQTPKLDGDVVVVEVNNKSQESICEYAPLVEYLRKNLSAPHLVVRANLVENVEVGSATPYTAKQKLDAMLVENSHLQSLISKFGLAFDY